MCVNSFFVFGGTSRMLMRDIGMNLTCFASGSLYNKQKNRRRKT